MARKVPTSIRLSPEIKFEAEKLAAEQNRSLTNLIETVLLELLQKHGIKPSVRR